MNADTHRARTRYSVNCSRLLNHIPLFERPRAAKKAGFEGVEFYWPFSTATPSELEIARFVAAIRTAEIQLVALNFFAGDMAAGDRGIMSLPGREEEFRTGVEVAIGIGEALGCRLFTALYGNRLDGVAARKQDDLALDNLTHAATAVGGIGGTVLLEPLSGADRYPLRTAAEVLMVVDQAKAKDAKNIALLADLYHLAVNGDDVAAVIDARAEVIGHVQIADAPGRGRPGSGSLPIERWVSDLNARGYQGWIGLEYDAVEDDPFEWLPRELRKARIR